jgi:hypothetical protein
MTLPDLQERVRRLSQLLEDPHPGLATWSMALGAMLSPLARPALLSMTDEQRAALFAEFCTECGSTDPRCQCRNDE